MKGYLNLRLNELVLPNGTPVQITAEKPRFSVHCDIIRPRWSFINDKTAWRRLMRWPSGDSWTASRLNYPCRQVSTHSLPSRNRWVLHVRHSWLCFPTQVSQEAWQGSHLCPDSSSYWPDGHSSTQEPSAPTNRNGQGKSHTPEVLCFLTNRGGTGLTEQEVSRVAAQALGFSGTCTPVTVFVTRVAFAVMVGVLVGQALIGGWHTVAVALQPLALPAAGAGASIGPNAGETGLITVWKYK